MGFFWALGWIVEGVGLAQLVFVLGWALVASLSWSGFAVVALTAGWVVLPSFLVWVLARWTGRRLRE